MNLSVEISHLLAVPPRHAVGLFHKSYQSLDGHTYKSGPVVRILDYWQGKLRFKSYALLPFVSERTIEQGCRSWGCRGCHAMAHPDFGRSVNPISTGGDRLCPPNYYWHPRIFRPSDGPVMYILISICISTMYFFLFTSGNLFWGDKKIIFIYF